MAMISDTELSQRIAEAARRKAPLLQLAKLGLASLPDDFAGLSKLETLNLGDNRLVQLPPTIGKLESLVCLLIGLNRLEQLPDSIGDLRSLLEIEALDNRLSRLPESLGKLTALVKLNLSHNQIEVLPESLGELSELQTLNLTHNLLVGLPDSLGALRHLYRLDLSYNRLRELPDSLGQLRALRDLDLRSNSLRNLPNTLGQLTHLTELKVQDNVLESLPSSICNLTRLERLDLSGQQLRSIPDSIGTMTNLKYIDLTDNALSTLPGSLGQLNRLEALLLHGNRNLKIPEEVLGPPAADVLSGTGEPASPGAILDYYYRVSLGAKPLNESKLILVGRGGVGKTSLVSRLVDDFFDPTSPQTEGIKITNWMRTLPEEERIRLHIWDFGGQEIMHATHQFFLTQRSLYLVVLSGREGSVDDDVEYWLKLITSFGGGSPVIVVMNKMDSHPFDLNRRHLRNKYNCIKEFVETDCESGRGMRTLLESIDRETSRLEHLRDLFPSAWFEIKDRLSDLAENFVTFEKYRSICAELGESDGGSQERLAGYLHSLGVALNFRDHDRLRDTNVLNPRWVTEGIYKVLNSRLLEERKGVLCLREVKSILDVDVYPPDKHMFLIELMRKFELCFEFPDAEKRTFLIPELLAKEEPEDVAKLRNVDHLAFVYVYEFIPEGLLARFIVRTHEASKEVGELRWRTGVVLRRDDNTVVVTADARERRVAVVVTGQERGRRGALAVVRDHFARIHASFKGLQVVEKVPIRDRPRVEVSYRHLLELERQGQKKWIPEDMTEAIDVTMLLDGYETSDERRRSVLAAGENTVNFNVDAGGVVIVGGIQRLSNCFSRIESVQNRELASELQELVRHVDELGRELKLQGRQAGKVEGAVEEYVTAAAESPPRVEEVRLWGKALVASVRAAAELVGSDHGAAVEAVTDAVERITELIGG